MSSSSDASGDNLQSIGECAGIDLINQPAEARNWVMEVLKTHMKKDQSVTVGNYCYLDGDKHVKVSIAMDVISAAVASEYVPQPAAPASLRHNISPVLKVQGPRHYRLPLHSYRCPRHQQRSAGSTEEERRRLALVRNTVLCSLSRRCTASSANLSVICSARLFLQVSKAAQCGYAHSIPAQRSDACRGHRHQAAQLLGGCSQC